VGVRCLNNQVIVIAHQAVSEAGKLVALHGLLESLEELVTVTVEEEERSPITAS
jgi:hypothetical protein